MAFSFVLCSWGRFNFPVSPAWLYSLPAAPTALVALITINAVVDIPRHALVTRIHSGLRVIVAIGALED